jgi:hypothetical protein
MTALLADELAPETWLRFRELVERLRHHRETLPPDVFAQFLLDLATSGDELSALLAVALVDELDDDAGVRARRRERRDRTEAIRDATGGFVDVVAGAGLDRRCLRSAGRRLERMLAPRSSRIACPRIGSRPRAPRRGRRRARAPCRRTSAGDPDLAGSPEGAARECCSWR